MKALFIGLLLLLPGNIYGQTGIDNPSTGGGINNPGGLQNPISANSIQEFLTALLDIIIKVGFPVIVLAVVYTGFLFVKAQGSPDELTTAKRALLWTLVGALLILGAQVLSIAIQGTVDELRADESLKQQHITAIY